MTMLMWLSRLRWALLLLLLLLLHSPLTQELTEEETKYLGAHPTI